MRMVCVVLAWSLFVVACAGRTAKPSADRTCVVLSVGEAKGLAHIGALDALKAHGFNVRCIVGNSMGSLVGGLYASDPRADLRGRYRALMEAYRQETIAEAKTRAAKGALVGIGLLLLSGGTLGWETVLGSAGAGALAGGASVVQLDRDRFQRVMESYYGGPMIEALLVRFETSYLVRSGAGLELQAARRGNLAEAISRSIANPFIFRVIGRSSG